MARLSLAVFALLLGLLAVCAPASADGANGAAGQPAAASAEGGSGGAAAAQGVGQSSSPPFFATFAQPGAPVATALSGSLCSYVDIRPGDPRVLFVDPEGCVQALIRGGP